MDIMIVDSIVAAMADMLVSTIYLDIIDDEHMQVRWLKWASLSQHLSSRLVELQPLAPAWKIESQLSAASWR